MHVLPPVLAGLPGGTEIWIVLIILLLLFGRRIPQVARSLGQGISQFKRGLSDVDLDGDGDDDDEDEKRLPRKGRDDDADAGGGTS